MEFLREVAVSFLKASARLEDLCFVFPNRRSMKFFQKYLGEEAGKPIISPEVMTINDFFVNQSDLVSADKLKLMHILWQVDLDITGKDPVKNSFDDFIYWGDILLNDFDDVDKYMADARSLFTNLSDLKEIDSGLSFLEESQVELIRRFWGTFKPVSEEKRRDRLLDTKEEFSRFWNVLYDIYEEFNARLADQGIGYEGKIYRLVAEKFAQGDLAGVEKYGKVVFVGLNAPNKCERAVLDCLRDAGKADFYWDFYGRIIRDKDNSASYFMTEYEKRYPSAFELDKNEEGAPEYSRFRLYSVPSAIAQTKVTASILDDIAAAGNVDFVETAVVLPDESLLLPMLDSVPESISDVNVTMGYPLQLSPAMSFLNLLGELHKLVKEEDGARKFYFKPLLSLIYHPYLTSPLSMHLKSEIALRKLYYISPSEIAGLLDEYAESLGKRKTSAFEEIRGLLVEDVFIDPVDIYEYLKRILIRISPVLKRSEKEAVFYCYKAVNQLQSLKLPLSNKTVFRVLKQTLSTAKIPYKGEPLSGLQIMGTLETRALDFRNVIILSANDGVFPASSRGNSYIPYNLRKAFGLPNYEYQDSVYAYYFYRLISRAENVYILYNTSSIDKNIKEVSRYISQLKLHYRLPIQEIAVHLPVVSDGNEAEPIVKTPEMIERLYAKYAEGEESRFPGVKKGYFSASLLNSYLDCPAQFYYKAVEELEEEEEIDEKIDGRIYGNVLHKTMELLYEPELGKIMTPEVFQRILKDRKGIENTVSQCMKEELKVSEIRGQNLIYRTLLVRSVQQVITIDMKNAGFDIQGVEKLLLPHVEVDGHQLRFVAFIDRVDRFEKYHRLLDYKTGQVDERNLSLDMEKIFNREEKRVAQMFQVCLYAYLSGKENLLYENEEVRVSLYVLRSMFKDGRPLEVSLTNEFIRDFEERLKTVMREIFSPEADFVRTEDLKKCEYCSYKVLCKR